MKHSLKRSLAMVFSVLFVVLSLSVLALAAGSVPGVNEDICPKTNGDHSYLTGIDYSCLDGKDQTPYIIQYCQYCEYTRKIEFDTPDAHIESVVKGTPATCYAKGISDGSVCERCGKVLKEQEVLEVLDHTDEDNDGWCDVKECGFELRYHCPLCDKAHDGNFFDRVFVKFFHNVQFQIQKFFSF